jgi:peptidoglycan/LPS O-acetylase OafA/YrhL
MSDLDGMTVDYDTYRQTKYFGSLDGLRCLAVAAVVWHHTGSGGLDTLPLAGRGFMGVDVFFLLTGFLITTLLLREKSKHGSVSLRSFYVRRLLRILPLYYSVLMLYIALVVLVERDSPEGKAFIEYLPYFLTFTSNWFVRPGERVIFVFAWALTVIIQFYLLWAPIEKYLKGIWPVVVMVGVIVFAAATKWHFFDSWLPPDTLRHRITISVSVTMGMGVLLAHLLHNHRGYELARKLIGWRWCSVAAFIVLVGCMSIRQMPPLVIHCAMALLIGSCVIRENHALAPVLGSRIMRHLGVISYGMYLLHMLVFNVVKRVPYPLGLQHPMWHFWCTLIGVALVATISFRYYENYFLRLKARFSRRGRHQVTEA